MLPSEWFWNYLGIMTKYFDMDWTEWFEVALPAVQVTEQLTYIINGLTRRLSAYRWVSGRSFRCNDFTENHPSIVLIWASISRWYKAKLHVTLYTHTSNSHSLLPLLQSLSSFIDGVAEGNPMMRENAKNVGQIRLLLTILSTCAKHKPRLASEINKRLHF